jgi:MFS family permease
LRVTAYRRLWGAQFTSNIGSWMQTVAAQWVMISLTRSPLMLTAIAAAGSIPVLLLAVPAGALGDLVDRRRLILVAQTIMLLAAAALAVLSAAHAITPWVLIGLLFVIGAGGALGASVWQTLQPELVGPQERSQAIALGSVNQNLARAIGPAIGGLLLTATSAALVFGVNAVSFVAVLGAVLITAVPKRETTLPREHVFSAIRAGGRFVANSPQLLSVIVRSIVFVFFAGAIWALLPLVAKHRLGLGSAGYGLLLACVGVGALLAANFGPAVKQRLSPQAIYLVSCLLVAVAAVLLGLSRSIPVAVIALIAAGAAWILCLGVMNTAYQQQLPAWAKARSFAYYLLAFQGANGIGALALGGVAQATSVRTGLLVIGAGLLVGGLLTWRLPLPGSAAPDTGELAEPMPLPAARHVSDDAPAIVNVEYALLPGSAARFVAMTRDLRRLRRRTGAVHWHLSRGIEDPGLFTESFVVGSWDEHERQHERVQAADLALLADIDTLLRPGHPRQATHWLGVRTPR